MTNGFASKALSETNGERVDNTSPPSLISNQLREELIRILRAGDGKQGGAFTVAIAAQVTKFAVAAREILMTEKLAQNDIASLLGMRNGHMNGAFGSLGGASYLGGSLGDINVSPMPLLPPINNENFGVQATREIVDAMRTAAESPAKLVEALVIARKNDLPDVVAALERKLGIGQVEATPPAPMHHGEGPVQ